MSNGNQEEQPTGSRELRAELEGQHAEYLKEIREQTGFNDDELADRMIRFYHLVQGRVLQGFDVLVHRPDPPEVRKVNFHGVF